MKIYYRKRVEKIITEMNKNSIDGVLLIDPASVQYFTGLKLVSSERSLYTFIGSDGTVSIFAPKLEINQAKDEAILGDVIEVSRNVSAFSEISSYVRTKNVKTLGIEGSKISYTMLQRLTSNEGVNTKDVSTTIAYIRSKKDLLELESIIRATTITEQALNVAKDMIMGGIKEVEIMNAVVSEMINSGAEWVAFIPIVASGARAAYPHGSSSNKILRDGELVVVDLGARVDGYCADLTRTFIVGKPNEKEIELHQIITDAIEQALKVVSPNVKASEIDKAARQVIEMKGYGEYFTHGLGHGIGLAVHEYPTLSSTSDDIIDEYNVVTIEPGIYISGFGGIRIEEDVLVTKNGYQLLSRFPRDLY
ncbi:MAG: Xaa-Pro peptidase family protein [Thermoprotei archaeon]